MLSVTYSYVVDQSKLKRQNVSRDHSGREGPGGSGRRNN
jgi:hypothetical protein